MDKSVQGASQWGHQAGDGCDVTTQNRSSPIPDLFHTVPLLLSLVAPVFKSVRPESPKSLLPKALSSLPADSSFTISWATEQGQILITPYLSTIHLFVQEKKQPGPRASSTRKPSQTTQLHPVPLGLHQDPTSINLPCLTTPIPSCIQLLPQTLPTGEAGRWEVGRGWEQTSSRPLLAGLSIRAPALTDPSLALAIARATPQRPQRTGPGRCTECRLSCLACGAQGTGDISSKLPRELPRGSRAQAVQQRAWSC